MGIISLIFLNSELLLFGNINFIQFVDFCEDEKYYYLVMELAKGGDLAQMIEGCKGQRMSDNKILSIFV